MKIAITGGSGFVGRHLARRLSADGHEVVLIARGVDRRDESVFNLANAKFHAIGTDDEAQLERAFAGCDAVAHCAGINREIGAQTYPRVHVIGTQNVVNAAKKAGVRRIALLSFLRARPNCGSGYHESKFAAEDIVRKSGLDYTVLKAGVIYGKGDHMLDHLSHAFHTFPVFGFVGLKDQKLRPLAVEDLVEILIASVIEGKLSRKTVTVTGPEEMTLRHAVIRVSEVVGRKPLMFPMPLWFHYGFAWMLERLMKIPLVAMAQVRILSEGLVEATGDIDRLPEELQPRTPFSKAQIQRGLPVGKSFGLRDLRCCCAR